MITTVYKLVRVLCDGRMISCAISFVDKYCLEYRIGQETRAREETLGVMCFQELRYTKTGRKRSCERILKCETRYKPRRLGRLAEPEQFSIEWFNRQNGTLIKRLHRRGNGPLSRGRETPPGTFVVRALTPVEIVEGK